MSISTTYLLSIHFQSAEAHNRFLQELEECDTEHAKVC